MRAPLTRPQPLRPQPQPLWPAGEEDRAREANPNPNPNPNPNQEKKIAHEKLAEETEDIFTEPAKLGVKLSPEFLESCYTPIIQSGGKFDLKPSAFSNGDNLYYGAPAPDRPSLPAHARLTCLASRLTSRLTTRLPPTRPLPTRRAL